MRLLRLLAVGACAGVNVSAQTVNDPALRAVVVANGLHPVGPNSQICTGFGFVGPRTVLLTSRGTGKVLRVDLDPSGAAAQPSGEALDLDIIAPANNDQQSEYGVQGIVLHPDFANNGWVYIRYDKSPNEGRDTPQSEVVLGPNFNASVPTQNVIERFVWDPSANGGSGALVFDRLIHSLAVDTRYHHGGAPVFGPDGMMYVMYGNLRHEVWVPGHSGLLLSQNYPQPQGIVADYGTIVRLTDEGGVPADNPFLGLGAPDGTENWWAYGFRNSFGMAFDPRTGSLWCTDNGEDFFDELNLVTPRMNSGHIWISGPINDPQQVWGLGQLVMLPGAEYRDPVYSWRATIGVTGLAFLSGSALGAAYENMILVGGVNAGVLRSFRLDGSRAALATQASGAAEAVLGTGFGGTFRGVIAMGMGPDRLPYILTAAAQLIRLERAFCAGDVDGDGLVDSADLTAVVSNYQETGPGVAGDVNHDGAVDFLDLSAVLAEFGASCPAPPPAAPRGVKP